MKKYPWFIIYTTQTDYFMQKIFFEERFNKYFKNDFELYPIKINFNKSKNFIVKPYGFLKIIKILKEKNIDQFLFTDLDVFIDLPSKEFKNYLLKYHQNYFIEDKNKFWGGIFKINSNDFISLEKDFQYKINKNDNYNFFEEKLFYKKFNKNYISFNNDLYLEVIPLKTKSKKIISKFLLQKNYLNYFKNNTYIIYLKGKK